MIAAAFCPQPPLLVPAVGAGEPVAVRAPAVEAVRWLASQPLDRLVLLGSGSRPESYGGGSTGSFAGFGVDFEVQLPGAGEWERALPLPLAVGAWLLAAAGWTGPTLGLTCGPDGVLPAWAAGPSDGLLVMGDGSARRSEKAPGWLDARAADFDEAVAAALASGDPARLDLDLAMGADLLAAGAPAWSAAATLLGGRPWPARVSYDDAPYGVGYFVATWGPGPEPVPS